MNRATLFALIYPSAAERRELEELRLDRHKYPPVGTPERAKAAVKQADREIFGEPISDTKPQTK